MATARDPALIAVGLGVGGIGGIGGGLTIGRPAVTIHLVGRGVVARRVRRMLRSRPVMVHDPHWRAVGGVTPGDVVVLAHAGAHAPRVPELLEHGLHVVTVGDELDDARELLDLDPAAADAGTSVIIGAAVSPGLSGLIARHLEAQLHTVDEIHLALHGTAGPACARSHHRALSGRSVDWHDDTWVERIGGSGRELCWFPEPIGAMDCYRARMAAPLLLHQSFPEVGRISARRSATRRDRFTARLPMLRPPPREGGIGALRVELRGTDVDGGRQCIVAGMAELVGTAAAATAAACASLVADRHLPSGALIVSDRRLPTTELLRRVQGYGVRLQEFTGVPQSNRVLVQPVA